MSFDDFIDPNDEIPEGPVTHLFNKATARKKNLKKAVDLLNAVTVPPEPSPESMLLREKYKHDYVALHQEMFVQSSGGKPLGPVQIDSVHHSHRIINGSGFVLKIEPRGLGKTSRTSNEVLAAILQGKSKYALIVASSLPKADEILEALKVECFTNEVIAELYPELHACFQHILESPFRAKYQTFKGVPTHISIKKGEIIFPCIEGQDYYGGIIQVKPKDNLRGLFKTVQEGPMAGRRLRPDLIVFDDIQTDEEAASPTSTTKIVTTIKKSALKTGSHQKRVRAIMTGTPITPTDTIEHFAENESAWQVVRYKLLISPSKREDLWFGEYATLLTNFDKTIPGDRLKAQLNALKFYQENRAEMDSGATVAWEWAYAYEEEPQVEISAIQHAYNIAIEDGLDVFNSECQCITTRVVAMADVKATPDQIIKHESHLQRMHVPLKTKYIVHHLDVHKEIITYSTLASSAKLEAMCPDYGTFPEQPAYWDKTHIVNPLSIVYPDIPEPELRIYQAVKDLIIQLAEREYLREDGLRVKTNLILVDSQYMQDEVFKACRESLYSNIVRAYAGVGILAKDKSINERSFPDGSHKHYYCVSSPSKDHSLMVLYTDVSFMKTTLHKGFKTRIGMPGCVTLYKAMYPEEHRLLVNHCTLEDPEIDTDPKNPKKTKIIWKTPIKQPNNDFFDNLTGCLAGLAALDCSFSTESEKEVTTKNINDMVKNNMKIQSRYNKDDWRS